MAENNNSLQAQIDALTEQLNRMTGRDEIPIDPNVQTDFVAHGSDRHAFLLGLKKAGDDDRLVVDGWTLEDVTMFGPACTIEFLEQFLLQKVNELNTEMPEIQSRDPREPNFAPTMWRPGTKLADLTE